MLMRPQPMMHVRILVLREDLQRASLTLAESQSFHPDPRQPEESRLAPLPDRRYQAAFDQARSRLDKIRAFIPLPEPADPEVRVVGLDELVETNQWLGKIWERCVALQEKARDLDERARQLEEEESALENFAELDVDLGLLRGSKRFLDFYVGVVPRENVTRLETALGLGGHLLFRYRERDERTHVVIVGPAGARETELGSVLDNAGFEPIPLPEGLDSSPEAIRADHAARRAAIAQERSRLEAEVTACADAKRAPLMEAEQVLTLAAPFVELDPAIHGTGNLAGHAGWVPENAVAAVEWQLEEALAHPFAWKAGVRARTNAPWCRRCRYTTACCSRSPRWSSSTAPRATARSTRRCCSP